MSTTVLDAYIKRRVAQYLGRLSEDLEKMRFGGQLLIVSPSGVLGVNAIREKTIATFASGPDRRRLRLNAMCRSSRDTRTW